MRKFIIFYYIICPIVLAENFNMIQAGKDFIGDKTDSQLEELKNNRGKYIKRKIKDASVKKLTIKKGDSVTFLNKDNVEHNVFGNDFNFTQKPGSKHKKVFTEAGTRTIRCAIHPRMKIEIEVKE